MYSTHGFGDIGSREACENQYNFDINQTITDGNYDQSNKNAYMMLNLNVSTMPVILRFGLCLPAICR